MKKDFSTKILREFGILFSIMFPMLFGFLVPFLSGHESKYWTLYLSLPFLIFGIFNPRKLLYPYKIWMKLGNFLGLINSNIIFGLVYLLVLLPIAFIMKIRGYDPLRKKKNSNVSYRENKLDHKIDLEKIF